MPFYDYRCQDCDTTFEVKRSMSEQGETSTPDCTCCGSQETQRVFGNFFSSSGNGGGGSASGPT